MNIAIGPGCNLEQLAAVLAAERGEAEAPAQEPADSLQESSAPATEPKVTEAPKPPVKGKTGRRK